MSLLLYRQVPICLDLIQPFIIIRLMGLKEKIQPNIYNQLIIIKTTLSSLLIPATFESLHKIYKQISLKICHLSRYTLCDELSTAVKQCLAECMQILAVIVQSSQHSKHGHTFVLFHQLLSKYQAMAHTKVAVNQGVVISFICHSDSSAYAQAIKHDEIQLLGSHNVQPLELNESFQKAASNSISLQNQQCICCSQIIMANTKINRNSKQTVINIRDYNAITKQNLAKTACGLINVGGGVIIIGAQAIQGTVSVSGVCIDNLESALQKQQQIRQVLDDIQPFCEYHIDKIGVHKKLLQNTNYESASNSFCFRIQLFDSKRIAYLKRGINNEKSNYYEVFKLDNQLNPKKVIFVKTAEKIESEYTLMHKRFNSKFEKVNPHQNINCYRPLNINWSISSKSSIISSPTISPRTDGSDQIKSRYKNMSLLILQSKNNDRTIKELDSALKKYKVTYELVKPYPEVFASNEKMRSVWMLSHEVSFSQVRGLLIEFESYQLIKSKMITVLPVYNAIQLDAQKFDTVESRFNLKYYERYPEQYRKEVFESGNKKLISLCFNSLSKAIFGYITLQWLNVWPYFTKEGTVYKKKI